ncbi:MAG: helicase C-terminal domain-containing protein [Dehalobacterium sp.]
MSRKEFDGVDFVVLDLETTGLDCQRDEIIEIGGVRISHGILCEEFATLIQPKRSIPEKITWLTGIDDEMVRGMPEFSQVLPQLESFLAGAVLVGHNIAFDLSFLPQSISDAFPTLDTVEIAKMLLPYEAGYSLGDLTLSLGIQHQAAHRALGDAKATAELFLYLRAKLKNIDLIVLETWLNLYKKYHTPLKDLINEEYGAHLCLFPQEKIRSRKLYLPVKNKEFFSQGEVSKEIKDTYRIETQEIRDLFQPGGRIDAAITGFQYRAQQEEMALGVADRFNQGGCFVVEAGTGTGKSLAYLLPSVLWSVNSGQKVVVSTHTVNLQEQLIKKDIPLAGVISGKDFSAALIKGRSHYLCLRKWEESMQNPHEGLLPLLSRLVLWLRQTKTGDIDELSLNQREMSLWKAISAGSDTCFNTKCPFYRGSCFVTQARKTAEQAQLIIVNHSLLLANAVVGENILPDYQYLIIDEAHHLEQVAEKQFSLTINYHEVTSLIQKLQWGEFKRSGGLLQQLVTKTKKWVDVDQDTKDEFLHLLEEAKEGGELCSAQLRVFFQIIDACFSSHWSLSESYVQTLRILPRHRSQNQWSEIALAGENLTFQLKNLINLMGKMGARAQSIEAEFGLEIKEIQELTVLMEKIQQTIHGLEILFSGMEDSFVCWLEYRGPQNFPLIHMAPVEVKDQLQSYLFATKTAVVLTSATLTVGNSFDYFLHTIGLDSSEIPVHTLQVASPFLYQEQVLLGVVSDIPEPGSVPDVLWMDHVTQALLKLITTAKGRTLVLFTSHHQLKNVYEKIYQPLKQEGITVFAHGVTGNRNRILEGFKNNEHSVILGANSFWEGIDVVGEALSLVVMVKLPFWPPTLPTVSARLDRYKERRLNGFRRYSLPQAIIRFKQGFGRLIRTHSDYGALCILDKRIVEKNYGKTFLKSLPELTTVVGTTHEVTESIHDWLNLKGGELQSFPSSDQEKMIE